MQERLPVQAQQQLDSVVSDSLRRIRQDRIGAPVPIQRLLTYFAEHLLDPELDVTQAKRACGIGDNSVAIQFHAVVGRPPSAYIEDRRLETASKLLVEPGLKIWQVAQGLGYSSISAFSRAFLRWSGERPSEFRRRHLVAARAKSSSSTGPSEPKGGRRRMLERVAEVQIHDVDDLIAQLCPGCRELVARHRGLLTDSAMAESAPRAKPSPSTETITLPSWHRTPPEGEEIDRYRADLIWSELESCSWQERRELVRRRLRLTSPSFFHFLRGKSREVGRFDPREGIRVAQLSLDSLESMPMAQLSATQQAQLWAQGWCCLANAQHMAVDFDATEKSLAIAQEKLRGVEADPVIETELLCMKASLRRDQRVFGEASRLLDQAMALAQNATPELRSHVLIRRATVNNEIGEHAASIKDLKEALHELRESPDGYLKCSAYQILAVCYEAAGFYREALELVPVARELCDTYAGPLQAVRLRWLEGRLARAQGQYDLAEQIFIEVHQSFLKTDDAYDSALACLDLAELYARQDRKVEMHSLSARLAPLFEALQLQREALAALKILRRGLEAQHLTTSVIDELRSSFALARNRYAGSPIAEP